MAIIALLVSSGTAAAADVESVIEKETGAVDAKIIAWRRDFHQNPELSNRETRTSRLVAEHLKKLGLTVETGIARTGVVALLETGKPGPTIALRADMDALPVVERTDVPFRSTARANYRGEEVGVMHACGHDAHTAVLMGVAEALVKAKGGLRGNVLFVFQPAEEGAPPGEVGGASEMLKAGIFDKYKPEVAIGSHAWASLNTGDIGYRVGPLMADSNIWRIVVKGKQSHGSRPWNGVDPILVASQIVTSLNTIVSRQVDITDNPAVLSVGIIKGGVRNNIIPESAEMIGTLRTFTPDQKAKIVAGMKRMAENVAAASGATAEFELDKYNNPVVVNEPKVTEKLLPVLERVAGKDHVKVVPLVTGSEDFAYFAQKVPSFFFFYGVTPKGKDAAAAPSNHSPEFYLDEAAIPLATRAMTGVVVAYQRDGAGLK
ncbi:MAG TPA: amidohydrolase [Steroidobacteraceae bacterium]|nr:amidohydrolase [Steroidobacteraceae bacterium]